MERNWQPQLIPAAGRNVLKVSSISPFPFPHFPQILEHFPFLPLEVETCPGARSPPRLQSPPQPLAQARLQGHGA